MSKQTYLVWAGATALAGLYAGWELTRQHPSRLVLFVLPLIGLSISLACAHLVMLWRTRGGRDAHVHPWRRPLVAAYGAALLIVMIPNMLADSFSPALGVFFGTWIFTGPILFAALGASDSQRPGWPRWESERIFREDSNE